MEREFVEEYKGVRIHVWKQTHSETGYEFLGHGHNMVKNPQWTPPTLLILPVFHAVSYELSALESRAYTKDKAVRKYKENIDSLQASAKYKESCGYSPELFRSSEKFLLTV